LVRGSPAGVLSGGFFASGDDPAAARANPRIPRDSTESQNRPRSAKFKKNVLTEELIKIPTHFRGLFASTHFISKI
jgi:hypothetical protein